jgi:hypothetical protein
LCTELEITKSLKHFYGLGAETIDTLVETNNNQEVEISGPDIADDSAEATAGGRLAASVARVDSSAAGDVTIRATGTAEITLSGTGGIDAIVRAAAGDEFTGTFAAGR